MHAHLRMVSTSSYTIATRDAELAQRKDTARRIGRDVDAALRRVGSAPEETSANATPKHRLLDSVLRCLFGHRVGQTTTASEHAVHPVAEFAAGGADASKSKVSTIFGSRETPADKLEAVAETMRQRVAMLDSRVLKLRAESVSLAQQGQKVAAMRILRRAKLSEAAASQNSNALMAIEQQSDLLAQADVQRKLSVALASSTKAMKNGAKMLSSAEKAIDDAHEARDVSKDFDSAMVEFSTSASGTDADDADLEEELNQLLAAERKGVCGDGTISEEAAVTYPSAPKVPVRVRRGEQARLLSNAEGSGSSSLGLPTV